ncbi:MAG: pyruvate dehydrogenase [Chloroflexi bacterium]|nr:pyruvate dehydrogenase [Chloroflexota bacterium]
MVHEANHIRTNPDRSKVGGHQASSASMVSILTALYFGWLRAGDRVAVKPHASPAYHAVQYVLGNLERRYLTTLRQLGGLQAYPSRTKDPDPVDFSTGSVGLGVAATLFAALADRYAEVHRSVGPPARPRRRFVGLVGDAELDEGNIWEAISDPAITSARLGNVLWIVDLNRQSLDRVVPGVRVGQLEAMFSAAGWRVLEAKYGRRLQALFAAPGGVALHRRIDEMSNEEYQTLVRMPGAPARARLVGGAPETVRPALMRCVAEITDAELPAVLADLGGHDITEILSALEQADADRDRPAVLFAYTMKGWGLPMAGDPMNHSALLSQEQIDELRPRLGIGDDDWATFVSGSPEEAACRAAAARLYPAAPAAVAQITHTPGPDAVPTTLSTRVTPSMATQDAFGNALVELSRIEAVAPWLVTTSPDVSISTSLGGWINRVGVFAEDPCATVGDEQMRLLRWQPGPGGQHIELGISEMNLFLLMGQLGLSAEINGNLLIPIGTVYDPFVCRGLDALIYGTYSGSKFVFAGTPAGVTLSPEGGAHQSAITVSIGMELPNLRLYEPCFARETEWCLLEGIRQCLDRAHGQSTYLRLSTRMVDQAPFDAAAARLGADAVHRQVLLGGYRLHEPGPSLAAAPRVLIAAAGPILPEAYAAALELAEEGVAATLLNVTSADRLYRDWQASRLSAIRRGAVPGARGHLETLIQPEERRASIVSVLDGASHALAFLGGAFGQPVIPLGVDAFGQSGTRADLYAVTGIDSAHIVNAALATIGEAGR